MSDLDDRPAATDEPGPQPPQTEQLLRRLIDIVENARSMPMSSSVMVSRDELLDILDDAVARLPDELRAARWLLKERDEFMAATRRDADELIAEAKTRVGRMVERTEVVKAADQRARRIVEEAEAEGRRLRREAEDFCDQKLASFEVVLERVSRTVAAGRHRLAATVEQSELAPPVDSDDNGFFDAESD